VLRLVATRAALGVVTLLAVCRSTHRESYLHIVMAGILGPILALIVIIIVGATIGSF